jgi:hypothetical protein
MTTHSPHFYFLVFLGGICCLVFHHYFMVMPSDRDEHCSCDVDALMSIKEQKVQREAATRGILRFEVTVDIPSAGPLTSPLLQRH